MSGEKNTREIMSNHDLESCLSNIVIETIYVHDENDVNIMNNLKSAETPDYEHPCPDEIGGHECNRALGEVFGNEVYLGDSRLNNTSTCTCELNTDNGTEIYTDYNNYYNGLSYFQWTNSNGGNASSRYSRIEIDSETVTEIASNTESSQITLSLEYAIENYGATCPDSATCDSPHENITWIRVSRQEEDGSITLLFNGCPENNIVTLDVCQTTDEVSCDADSSDFLSSWGWEDNGTNEGYMELNLIPDIPSNWPVPGDVNAPENYSSAEISTLSQTGLNLQSEFEQLDGLTDGFFTLNYVNGDIIQYSISSVSYETGEDLIVEFSGLVFSELDSYEFVGEGDTFGVCISSNEPEPSQSITPSVTPTITPSITPTITPSITPTTTPDTPQPTPPQSPQPSPTLTTGLTYDCVVLTILPMEVICLSKNASGPDIPDGSTQVIITGGTPQYTILWENGETTAEITGLTPGSYTVTVSDYYNDYVITVTCIVGSDSFYLDKFVECPDCTTIECYFRPLNTPTWPDKQSNNSSQQNEIYISGLTSFDQDMIYTFIGLEGCYEYDSTILWSGETYSALTIENSYLTCNDCVPVIPPPVIPPTLCLNGTRVFLEFIPDPDVDNNGNFTWTNSSDGLSLTYNIDNTRWEITPWNNISDGIMVQNSTLQIPTGTFINLGNTQSTLWTMTEGPCPETELSMKVNTSSETCKGYSDGAVILEGVGGTPPYEYRIQGVLPYPNYTNIGVFTNLLPSNYLAEVKDTDGDIFTVPFTIGQGENETDYVLNVTSNIITGNESTRTWAYAIQITPNISSLSVGETLTFDISLTHTRTKRDTGIAQFISQHTITKNGNVNIPYITSPTNTNINPTSCSVIDTNDVTEVFTETVTSVTLNTNDTSIEGEVTQTLIIDGQGLDCSLPCRMEGMYRTELQVTNFKYNGPSDCKDTSTLGIKDVIQELNVNDCSALP